MRMPAALFDTHVHLNAAPLIENLDREIDRARQAGVESFLIPGVRWKEWPQMLSVARAVPGALVAPGLHPLAAAEWNEEVAGGLIDLFSNTLTAAVGEIGLDALIDSPDMEVQERAFRSQLRLAVEAQLPVLIHCRRATGRLLDILRQEKAQRVGGIFHAFSGSIETAMEAIRLGFVLGFGGPLTYPNARRIPEVLRQVPKDAIVLETDAPDMPPHPHRGEPNAPANLPLIARRVAEVRGWSEEETARVTTENARRILKPVTSHR
ncbi:TatD family hydrolase [Desulfuromonas sp. TF]|uniref:TatD family hydrolase n=1 Tax=Desulfuromonas sp. TF TaxID=1232410 RepID=UPI0003FDA384|nr:TatD family hydrolase [Desulfuromonas sp. TF]